MEDTKPTQAQLAQPRPVEKHRRRGAVSTSAAGSCASAAKAAVADDNFTFLAIVFPMALAIITQSYH